MRFRRMVVPVATLVLVASAAVVSASVPATAEVIGCESNTESISFPAGVSKTAHLEHWWRLPIGYGTVGDFSKDKTFTFTMNASISLLGTANVSVSGVLKKLGIEARLSSDQKLATDLAITKTETVHYGARDMAPGEYVVFDGYEGVHGQYEGGFCDGSGHFFGGAWGGALSWILGGENDGWVAGVLNCKVHDAYSPDSVEAAALGHCSDLHAPQAALQPNPDGNGGTMVLPDTKPSGGTGSSGGASWSGSRNDLTGDGRADLLALYTDRTLHWYPGKGDGSFWSARDLGNAGFRQMAKADLNGDGNKDLLALYDDYTLHWYPGKGDGSFWSARNLGNAGFKLMALGDLNGDGIQDLLALYVDYTLHWYPGKGDGCFWSARELGPAGFREMALADLDNDGNVDLLALYDDYTLHWYPGKGDGSFWSARDLGNAGFRQMSLADLNGDGKADLLALYDDYTLHWYPGKGDGSFWSARDLGNAGFELMVL
jgi:hypothetical protein